MSNFRLFVVAALASLGVACSTTNSDSVMIEAESFSNKGGWVVDAMDQMGSPYLMAHGMGVPVEDASTQVEIPAEGVYHIYVRTYNWTSPWSEGRVQEHHLDL